MIVTDRCDLMGFHESIWLYFMDFSWIQWIFLWDLPILPIHSRGFIGFNL